VLRDPAQRRRAQQRERSLGDHRRGHHIHRVTHPGAREEARAEAVAGVLPQHCRIAAFEILRRDVGRERRQSHRAIETAGGQRRDCAGGVADEQSAIAGDVSQHAADGNQPSAPFDRPSDVERQRRAKCLQCARGIPAFAMSRQSDMRFVAVVRDPGDVAGREPRIDEAVQHRLARDWRHDLFDADQHFAIGVEAELSGDRRTRAVGADHESRQETFLAAVTNERDADGIDTNDARRRNPAHARARALFEQLQIEPRHPSDAELIAPRAQRERASRRGVQDDVADRRAELLVRQRKVLPRLAHEDAGGVYRRGN